MYHAANARATMYGDTWRFRLLALVGWLLGIQFKVDGMPFGAAFDRVRFEQFWRRQNSSSPFAGRGAGVLGVARDDSTTAA